MKWLKIVLSTESDAFVEYPASEVARILRQYANRIDQDGVVEYTRLKDINGNSVGEVRVYKDESVEA